MRLEHSVSQAAAELAFAKWMGWDDWTFDEESEEGMVRGYRVQWHPDPNAGLIVYDQDDDDTRYVLVTGNVPTMRIHGSITVAEARRKGFRIREG
jgi:hypothetical protein